MKKVAKLIKALILIIKKPYLLNKIIDDVDVNKQVVIDKYNLPQGLKTIEITDLLPGFNETIEPFSYLDGGSTPIDLALLKGLAKSKTNCLYFEIGTWKGESVANVASVAKECVTLNLADKEMEQMGFDKNYINLHRYYSKNLKNVIHLQANSLTYDFKSLNKKFDLLFIDGDHHYESVKSDTKNAFSILKNNDSIIVWHDYGNTPTDIRFDVLLGILDGTPKEKQQYLYHVSNTLCAIYTTKAIESKNLEPFISSEKYFSVTIKANLID